ncbi:hypothetical protein Tco_0185544, partial [Tanacetum coccineum]
TKSKGKAKEKVDVARGKGIELLSDVALTEEAMMKEAQKKSLRDFHKSHPGGSGMIAKKPPSVDKIAPTVTSEGTGDKLGVPDVTKDDSTESESESWGNDEDDSNDEDQQSSNEGNEQKNESEEQESDSKQDEESEDDDQEEEEFDEENESKYDEVKSDEEQEMDDTTDQDVHETIFTVPKKTEVPVTSSSRSSDLVSKFLNFLDIPHGDAKIISPLDVQVYHEVPRTQAPTLLTIPISIIVHVYHESLTARIKEQVKDQLPQILLEEVSNFAPPVIERLFKESSDEVTLAKTSSQPQSTYEAASTLTEFELKKILIDKMMKSESYLTALEHRECFNSLKKSYDLDKDFFYSYDVYTLKRSREDKDKDEDPSAGSD